MSAVASGSIQVVQPARDHQGRQAEQQQLIGSATGLSLRPGPPGPRQRTSRCSTRRAGPTSTARARPAPPRPPGCSSPRRARPETRPMRTVRRTAQPRSPCWTDQRPGYAVADQGGLDQAPDRPPWGSSRAEARKMADHGSGWGAEQGQAQCGIGQALWWCLHLRDVRRPGSEQQPVSRGISPRGSRPSVYGANVSRCPGRAGQGRGAIRHIASRRLAALSASSASPGAAESVTIRSAKGAALQTIASAVDRNFELSVARITRADDLSMACLTSASPRSWAVTRPPASPQQVSTAVSNLSAPILASASGPTMASSPGLTSPRESAAAPASLAERTEAACRDIGTR